MNKKIEKIPYEKMLWLNTKFEGKDVTFIEVDKLPYLLITKVIEADNVCPFCEEEGVSTWLVGKANTIYRLHFCSNCLNGSLQESEKDYKKIPIWVLELISDDFVFEENEK